MNYGWCKTERQFVAWLNKQMRKSFWVKHPARLALMKQGRKRLPNPKTGRLVFHHQCAMCNEWKPESEIEVNHKKCAGSMTIDNIAEVFARMAVVGEDDLEKLCKGCHEVVTYTERTGMTIEEAKIEKRVISYINNSNAKKQKSDLEKVGIRPASTEALRRVQIRDHLRRKLLK